MNKMGEQISVLKKFYLNFKIKRFFRFMVTSLLATYALIYFLKRLTYETKYLEKNMSFIFVFLYFLLTLMFTKLYT